MLEAIFLIFLLALIGAITLIFRGLVGFRTLDAGRAEVIGHRHRRTRFLWLGLGLLVTALLVGCAGLRAEMKHGGRWVYASDSFVPVEKYLSYQADRSRPWDPQWGDWIERCHAEGKLSPEQWNRYLTQGMNGSFAFHLRPRVHAGDPLPWMLQSDGRRAGSISALQLDFEDVRIDWIAADEPVSLDIGRNFGWNNFGGGECIALGPSQNQPISLPMAIGEGVQQFVLHATVSVGPFIDGKVQPIVSKKLELFASTEVVPATQATMELVDRPDLAQAVRRSLSVSISPGMLQPVPVLAITANHPPIGLSFDVFVRVNGVEAKSGSFACPEGVGDRRFGMGVPGFSPGARVDIILRSSAAPALNNIGPLKAWKGEITFKNIGIN